MAMQWLIDIIFALCKAYTDEQIALQAHVPRGIICPWYGTWQDVPDGWGQCNGTDGTPDLRHKFIYSSGLGIPDHATGGSETHTHAASHSHEHPIPAGTKIQAGTGFNDVTSYPTYPPVIQHTSTYPTYYALRYIMKL